MNKPIELPNIRIITISGRIGAGSTSLAKHLAQKLGWKHIEGGEIFWEAIRQKMDAVLIFLTPPSLEELKKRLAKRGTETQAVLDRRLQEAEHEMDQVSLYDYTVTNDTIENSVRNILNLVQIERQKKEIQK